MCERPWVGQLSQIPPTFLLGNIWRGCTGSIGRHQVQELAVLSIGVWQEAVGGSGDHLVGASAAAPPPLPAPSSQLSHSPSRGGSFMGKGGTASQQDFAHQSCRMAMLGAPAHKGMHRRSPAAPEAPSAAAACLCPASRNCSHRFAADSAAERIRVDLAWRDAAHPQAKSRLLRLFCRRSEQAHTLSPSLLSWFEQDVRINVFEFGNKTARPARPPDTGGFSPDQRFILGY
jgi:hypothetical protein